MEKGPAVRPGPSLLASPGCRGGSGAVRAALETRVARVALGLLVGAARGDRLGRPVRVRDGGPVVHGTGVPGLLGVRGGLGGPRGAAEPVVDPVALRRT